MAQGKGMPKMPSTTGGAGFNTGTGPKVGQGKAVGPASRGYKQGTPGYMNTAVTHQGITKKSGK